MQGSARVEADCPVCRNPTEAEVSSPIGAPLEIRRSGYCADRQGLAARSLPMALDDARVFRDSHPVFSGWTEIIPVSGVSI